MGISAKDIAQLRKMTGAGMMDCKKALTEGEGDFDKAIEFLRKKGQKVSASRADRNATEGSVFAVTNESGTEAIMIELNCETDFVALNEDFQKLGSSILDQAKSHKPNELAGLLELKLGEMSISEKLVEQMGRIGEKLVVSKYELITADKSIKYIHPGARVGVIVGFNGVEGVDVDSVGKDIAMQIAAMAPVAIDKDGVSQDLIQKEVEIGKEQARQEGKPEAILEKIAMGKLNKYFQENTLLNQGFVKDSTKSVKQYLKDQGPDLKIVAFKRFQLGES